MCLTLPARVVAVRGQEAEVEMVGGMRVTANTLHCPEVAIDQYVLVDRGLVLQVIDAAEAQAIMDIYDEIGQMLTDADTLAAESAPAERLPLTESGTANVITREALYA